MGVVYYRDEEFAFLVELAGGVDEAGFAFVVVAGGFEVKGLAEEAQDIVPAVEGAVDDGDEPVAGVVVEEVLLEDCFSSAGFAEDGDLQIGKVLSYSHHFGSTRAKGAISCDII